MKKIFWYGLAAVALVVPMAAFAAEFRTGDQPSVREDEYITNDVYMAGSSVKSAGTVAGDVVVAGGSVTVSGDVGGDVIAGGGNITILSNVADDVRVGGGNIVIQGEVGGDLIIGGGQVTIGGPGVGGDVVIGGGVIRLDAPVMGSLRIGGGNVYINAPIAGDITIIGADKVTLGSAAVVYGNITYKAKAELTKEEGAVVNGTVNFEPIRSRQFSGAFVAGLASLFVLGKFLTLLACALVVGLIFRRYGKEAVLKAVESPLLEIGRGLLVFAALPVLSVIMFVTVVGIPFGVLGLVGFVALMMFAWIFAPIIIGSVVYRYFSKGEMDVSWKTILLGVFIFEVLSVIPLLGWLAQALAVLVALGVITAIKFQVAREWL